MARIRKVEKDTVTSQELYSMVLALNGALKCPGCSEDLQRDSLTCVNGHCVCVECGDVSCPKCGEGFSTVQQNFLMSQILDILPHTCRHQNCSVLFKADNDHESYCRFKPTNCRLCGEDVPAEDLSDHIKKAHPDKRVLEMNNESIRNVITSLEEGWCVVHFFYAEEHYIWLMGSHNPATGVVSFTFIPVFCGRPEYDMLVKMSFKCQNKDYEVNMKIDMSTNDGTNEENCILVPISVIQHCYNREKKEFFFNINSRPIMEVFVKHLSGKITSLEVKASDTVAHLKTLIEEKEGIEFSEQRLVYEGSHLEDERTLTECNIKKGSVLYMYIRLGGRPCTICIEAIKKHKKLEATKKRKKRKV